METSYSNTMPAHCPVCRGGLMVTRLQCPFCGTDVAGSFSLSRLGSLREPHASLIEMFLRTRGNMKEMERALQLSYPTVRARLEEALHAAGMEREVDRAAEEAELANARASILDVLERGEIDAETAVQHLLAIRPKR